MARKNILFIVGILTILLLTLSFTSAITGAMGNARMILYPELNGWTNTVIEKSILVKNVNDVLINITLEVDKDSEKFIELIDDFYQLEPGTEERAQFVIRVKKEGTYNGRINVYFRDAVNEKAPGVALASEIIIIAKKDQGYEEIEDKENENPEDENPNNLTITRDIIQDIKDIEINSAAMIVGSSLLLIILLILLSVMAKKNKKKRRKINGKNKS